MPELPEVEIIRQGLSELIGKKITSVFCSQKNLRITSSLDLKGLEGDIIISITRRARYLIINLKSECALIIHLGMSGKLTHEKKWNQQKHDHFVCTFNNGESLIFNDPRRFGFVDLVTKKNLANHKMLGKLACEPLSIEFNFEYLAQKLQHKKTNIKTTMMDNEIVVGVGNIYINESLFAAKISPLRSANSLKKNEIKKLIEEIKKILQQAIKLGGSSISDYVNAKGNKGNFQNNFKIYGRHDKNCLHCHSIIVKIVQNGRSSFFCKKCQK